jgi:hypothetical protein
MKPDKYRRLCVKHRQIIIDQIARKTPLYKVAAHIKAVDTTIYIAVASMASAIANYIKVQSVADAINEAVLVDAESEFIRLFGELNTPAAS